MFSDIGFYESWLFDCKFSTIPETHYLALNLLHNFIFPHKYLSVFAICFRFLEFSCSHFQVEIHVAKLSLFVDNVLCDIGLISLKLCTLKCSRSLCQKIWWLLAIQDLLIIIFPTYSQKIQLQRNTLQASRKIIMFSESTYSHETQIPLTF